MQMVPRKRVALSHVRWAFAAKEFYLGIGGEGRRSFQDVKH